MHVVDMNLTITDRSKSIPNVHSCVAYRLDLRTRQHHTCFISVFDEVVMGSFFVLSQYLAIIFLHHADPPHESSCLLEINCINYIVQNQE
ncbi:hypothetical protein D3C81_724330 [compost metagenome]